MGTARIVVNSLHIKGDKGVVYSFVSTPEVRIGVAFGSGGSQSLPATELPGVSSWLSYVVYLGAHLHGKEATSVDFDRVRESHYEFLGSFLGRLKSRRRVRKLLNSGKYIVMSNAKLKMISEVGHDGGNEDKSGGLRSLLGRQTIFIVSANWSLKWYLNSRKQKHEILRRRTIFQRYDMAGLDRVMNKKISHLPCTNCDGSLVDVDIQRIRLT